VLANLVDVTQLKEMSVMSSITRLMHDIRGEAVGGYSGPVGPAAPIGTFGNRVLLRRQGAGSFAGDPDLQRQGSFADVDRS
jgi:hypothetical protein